MMLKSKPSAYRGHLTLESAANGITQCKKNAEKLLEDAKLLVDNSRFPSACALAVLAIEEISKPAIIRKLVLASSRDQLKDGWALFTNHLEKTSGWIVPMIVKQNPESFEQFISQFAKQKDPLLLDSIKQLSLYVGCYGNSHWATPSQIIDDSLAKSIIAIASILISSGQIHAVDSEEGLLLWQQTLKGSFSTGPVRANNAVVSYFQKAKEVGITKGAELIPREVAFDFMLTVLVLSGKYPLTDDAQLLVN